MKDKTKNLLEALRQIKYLTSPDRYEALDPGTVVAVWEIAHAAIIAAEEE